ncbi:MAG TPA: helix-turn-helix domain-containing protein [Candidatus Andersenbacteria bacterium]|nr:helix-turn-helix domain-containing protein [Candidatus Andersenbacteria bacterium]
MTQDNQEQEFLTIEEAAHKLRVKPISVYRMCRRGELPAVKVGRSWRISNKKLSEMFKIKP